MGVVTSGFQITGPFSSRKPSRELHPGPPFSHIYDQLSREEAYSKIFRTGVFGLPIPEEELSRLLGIVADWQQAGMRITETCRHLRKVRTPNKERSCQRVGIESICWSSTMPANEVVTRAYNGRVGEDRENGEKSMLECGRARYLALYRRNILYFRLPLYFKLF